MQTRGPWGSGPRQALHTPAAATAAEPWCSVVAGTHLGTWGRSGSPGQGCGRDVIAFDQHQGPEPAAGAGRTSEPSRQRPAPALLRRELGAGRGMPSPPPRSSAGPPQAGAVVQEQESPGTFVFLWLFCFCRLRFFVPKRELILEDHTKQCTPSLQTPSQAWGAFFFLTLTVSRQFRSSRREESTLHPESNTSFSELVEREVKFSGPLQRTGPVQG